MAFLNIIVLTSLLYREEMRPRSSAGSEQVPSKHQVGGSSPLGVATLLLTLMSVLLAGCFEAEKKVSGTIDILPEFKTKIGPNAALYVVARPAGQTAGPPAAVRKFAQPLIFPIQFQLLKQDSMFPENPFEGELSISVRIAQGGSATPVTAGDLEGTSTPKVVRVGEDSPVQVLIDHAVQR